MVCMLPVGKVTELRIRMHTGIDLDLHGRMVNRKSLGQLVSRICQYRLRFSFRGEHQMQDRKSVV